eukprot:1976350-Pyramimonas_sp.AAC.1
MRIAPEGYRRQLDQEAEGLKFRGEALGESLRGRLRRGDETGDAFAERVLAGYEVVLASEVVRDELTDDVPLVADRSGLRAIEA